MSRFLRVYLLCIVLPALAVAWGGLRLLRIDARNRAGIVAENAQLHAEGLAARVRDSFRDRLDRRLDRLAAAPDGAARRAAVLELARADPAARAAFLWREGEGLVLPRRAGAAAEERRFLDRWGPVLGGVAPWTAPGGAGAGRTPGGAARGFRPGAADGVGPLAWVRVAPGETAGFEVETAWLFAEAFARRRDLFGGGGRAPAADCEIVGAAGAVLVPGPRGPAPAAAAAGAAPAVEVPLGPPFPDWRLRVRSAGVARASSPRFALGAALLGLVLLSLVAGGYVLLRAARRERLDSLRKTDFVSNVSHELRTPLTSIRMFSELLAEDRIPDPARRRRALGTVAAESARLSRLVDGVLDFSRLERGRRRYDLRPLDLGALLEEMRDETAGGGFVLRTGDRGAGGRVALADRDAVRQIVLNLLDNAAKYASAGGPPELAVRDAGNGAVALAVADRGPGVPPRAAKRIFDRFYRADDATTAETRGSGLGLSIARRLARGMGGDLAYRPREGGGAVFELTLPRAQPAAR